MPVVLVEKQNPHVSVVTLNRPERRNALTVELMKELIAAVESSSADEQQRVLILRGAGKCFCAGLDLQETALTQDAHAAAEIVAKTLVTLSQTRLITIAAVHGAAVAGGAGVMSACDFVVAEAHTKFGYPEARRGLVAGLVSDVSAPAIARTPYSRITSDLGTDRFAARARDRIDQPNRSA